MIVAWDLNPAGDDQRGFIGFAFSYSYVARQVECTLLHRWAL
jgi:hypothetical protein